jgi:hypothetical protein
MEKTMRSIVARFPSVARLLLSSLVAAPVFAWQSSKRVVAAKDVNLALVVLFSSLFLAPTATQAAQPVEVLMEAMELDMSQVVTSSITSGLDPNMFDVRADLGVISPYNAPTFAVLSTGDVNNITDNIDHDYPDSGIPDTSVGDRAFLAFDIQVPQYANSFSFSFYFLSREYPEWVGSNYNDTFEVTLDSNAYQGQIVFDAFGNPITINNALFSVVDPVLLAGTGFDADGGTGWVNTIAPCQGGETMHIQFEIYDVADGVWDSAVLLDNFQFSENEAPEDGPVTAVGDDDDSSAGDDDDSSAGDDDDSSAGDDDDDDDSTPEEPPCSVPPVTVGDLGLPGGDFDFSGDEVTYSLIHNRDIDEEDGGCIVEGNFEVLLQGVGCTLSLAFESDGDHLLLNELSLGADSFCPNWTDAQEGQYMLQSGGVWVTTNGEVEDPLAESACIQDVMFELHGTAILARDDNVTIEVELNSLRIEGDFWSTGVPGYTCAVNSGQEPPGDDGGSDDDTADRGVRGGCQGCASSFRGGTNGVLLLPLALLALFRRRGRTFIQSAGGV